MGGEGLSKSRSFFRTTTLDVAWNPIDHLPLSTHPAGMGSQEQDGHAWKSQGKHGRWVLGQACPCSNSKSETW